LTIHPDQPAADTGDDVAHPGAEDPVDRHHHRVAGFHEVDEARLHAGTARGRDRNRQRIGCLEHVAQQLLGLVHQGQKRRVQVADAGCGHGLQDPGGNVARSRAHQQALARVNIAKTSWFDGRHGRCLLLWSMG